MKNVLLDVVRKILHIYIYISPKVLQQNSLFYYFEITKLLYEKLQNDVKYLYFKRNILENILPNSF